MARLTYDVTFNANAEQLKQQLKDISQELQRLGSSTETRSFDRTIASASAAALDLKRRLQEAVNVDTGKLNLAAFQRSLRDSGLTLADYQRRLSDLGPQGMRVFEQVATAVNKAELPLRRSSLLVEKFMTTLSNTVRWQIANAAIRTFTRSISSAYGYAKNLDSSLNSIRIVTGKSADEMARFAKQANQAAKALSTTTTEYTDASLIYYQQGLNDTEAQNRANITVKMANVTGDAAEEVSQQLTAVWNNFAKGSDNLELFADKMVALGAATASSSSEIAGGVQQFAAVAQTVGMSYDYAVTMLATLTARTRQSETVVGTGLRTLLSRFESLALGETLEDGVDLTKYTVALQKVGVEVLDAAGHLREFDDIVNDTAAAWQTLDKEQQIALATTVGGIRQYATFVNMMEGWEDFQKNLQIAQGAEGALQEQADIYAESWEAARDRVKAAAEDVYDSLLNRQAFIAIDNMVTPLLTGIATVIDSAGGLPGVLAGVAVLANTLGKASLVNSIERMGNTLGIMTGAQRQDAAAFKQNAMHLREVTRVARSAYGKQYASYTQEPQAAAVRQQIISLNDKAGEYASTMSDSRRAQYAEQLRSLELEERQLATMQEEVVASAELVDQTKKELLNVQLSQTARAKTKADFAAYYGGQLASQKQLPGVAVPEIASAMSGKNTQSQNIAILLENLQQVRLEYSNLSQVSQSWENVETVRLEEVQRQLAGVLGGTERVKQAFKDGTEEQLRQELDLLLQTAEKRIARIEYVLRNIFGRESTEALRILEEMRTETNDLGTKMRGVDNTLAGLRKRVGKTSPKEGGWAEGTQRIVQSVSMAAMSVSALSSLFDTLQDESMDSSKRVVSALMSISLVTPTVVAGINAIGTAIKATAITAETMSGIIGLAVLAIGGIVAAVGAFRKSTDDLVTAAKNSASELESLNSELETTQSKIEELQKLAEDGSITVVQQAELEQLQLKNDLLEAQIRLKEQSAKQDAEAANKALVRDAANERYTITKESTASTAKISSSRWSGAMHQSIVETKTHNAGRQEAIDYWIGYLEELSNASYATDEELIEANKKRQNAIDELNKIGANVSKSIENANDYTDPKELKKWLDQANQILAATNSGSFFEKAIAKVKSYSTLVEAGKKNLLNADYVEDLANKDDDLKAIMDKLGVSAKQVANYFNDTAKAQEKLETSSEKLLKVTSALATGQNNVESLSKLLTTFFDDGIVQADAFDDIGETFGSLGAAWDNFVTTLGDDNSSTEAAQTAADDLASAYLNQTLSLDGLTTANRNYVIQQLKKIGVTNAEEVVDERLAAEEKLLTLATDEHITELADEIDKMDANSAAAQELTTKLNYLVIARASANESDLSSLFSDEAAAALTAAGAFGAMGIALADYQKVKSLLDFKAAHPNVIIGQQDAQFIESFSANLRAKTKEFVSDISSTFSSPIRTKLSPATSTSKSSSSSSTTNEVDRYQLINKRLERQETLLDNIGDKISRTYGVEQLHLYDSELEAMNKQLDLQNQKLKEAQNYRDNVDIPAITAAKINLIRDGDGEIDFEKTLQQYVKADNYSEIEKILNNYKDSLDTIEEQRKIITDLQRTIFDEKLKKINATLEVVVDTKNMREVTLELQKTYAEAFGDALTHGLEAFRIDETAARNDITILTDYRNEYAALKEALETSTDPVNEAKIKEEMETLQKSIADTTKEMIQYAESLEEIIPNAVSAASERFNSFINELQHNDTVMQAIRDLYDLQGQTYRTAAGYNRLQAASEARLNNLLKQAKMQRQEMVQSERALTEASDALAAFKAEHADYEHTPGYDILKKSYDALLEEYNSAQEAMLEGAKSTMEQAKEIFSLAMERVIYDFGEALTNGAGLDLLQDQYDHYIDTEERYLDSVNEAYETAAWYNKLQKDINDATNAAHADELKALQAEIDLRRENGTLNKYDLDILEAKYNVLKAQQELEDAQNAKNDLRLVRDSAGNWNYQYTANQDGILDAESNLGKARADYYNIAKQQVQDVTGEILSTWEECQSDIEELYNDMTLTDEERAARAAEIYEYYTTKVQDLEREKYVAIQDMTQAGSEAINGFDNVYAQDLGNMTSNTKTFEEILRGAMEDSEGNMNSYKATVHTVAEESGTDLGDLGDALNDVTRSTEAAYRAGDTAMEKAWNQVNAVLALKDAYVALNQELMKAAKQGVDLSEGAAHAVTHNDIDYSDFIASGIAQGWITSTSDEAYQKAAIAREAKIIELGLGADYYREHSSWDYFQGLGQGSYFDEEEWKRVARKLGIAFDSGGYTGDFDNAKLAFLHEKELVLNQEDTKNMLAAVQLIRGIPADLLQVIEASLDGNAKAAASSMGAGLGVAAFSGSGGTLEQHVTIEHVEFPNVSSAGEIEAAFASIVNDAAQFARRN